MVFRFCAAAAGCCFCCCSSALSARLLICCCCCLRLAPCLFLCDLGASCELGPRRRGAHATCELGPHRHPRRHGARATCELGPRRHELYWEEAFSLSRNSGSAQGLRRLFRRENSRQELTCWTAWWAPVGAPASWAPLAACLLACFPHQLLSLAVGV